MEGEIDWSAVFGALANEQRRLLLRNLRTRRGPVALSEAVDDLSGGADDLSGGADDRRRVAVGLYHVHLPKLEAVGIVEFDLDGRVIDRGPAFEAAADLLDHASRVDGSRGRSGATGAR
ncbi:DUF7344 domain-containing protein [Haloplanus halophilus]|uniref:DUF7344 domain-containing protein n=1 Tax=Haloplanus halophilus TaxID=2949993 RepID=UPI00203F4733|nr:hypothetical protein [Haloplanus sp. GDY1]